MDRMKKDKLQILIIIFTILWNTIKDENNNNVKCNIGV